MTEPDVALTDFALTLMCSTFVILLFRFKAGSHRNAWIVFFASISLGSLIGGLVHGFFLDQTTAVSRLLWSTTLLTIGITAASAWVLAGYTLFKAKGIVPFLLLSSLLFIIYAITVLFVSRKFIVAIVNYLPAIVALFIASFVAYFRERVRAHLGVCLGLMVTFIASGIQQAQIGIHPIYFNHNALFHVVQAIGLLVVFVSAKHLLRIGFHHELTQRTTRTSQTI